MFRAVMLFLWVCLAAALPAARAAAQTITVGSLTLTHCIKAYDGYCGTLVRPLDPTGQVQGSLTIGFEYYPHTDTGQPGLGAIAAQEGGPGYSTTGSRDGYVRLFTPLRTRRDIVLIDKRGTGRSAAIDCRKLQDNRGAGLRAVRECGWQLGKSAWLYSSTYAADDVAAVLQALGTGAVDYYGDSYATFFGQVFATRHPDLVRTITLDSAYPVLGGTPYFQTEIENGPIALERVCARSPACAAQGPSITIRFNALLNSLRQKPITGTAPGANGETRNVTVDVPGLFLVFYDVGNNLIAYRDLDAAARAYLDAADRRPLLRLVAEAQDAQYGGRSPAAYSTGLFDAVICTDYPQLFDARAPEAVRHEQFADAIAHKQATDPDIYAPFTLDEALRAPQNPENLNSCEAWPVAPAAATPGNPVPAGTIFPSVPVLVLSGELDTVTSPREGAQTTALFPKAWFVVLRNTGHETAVGDGGNFVPPYGGDLARCAGPIVLQFIASGGDPGDTSCALTVRPIRTVPEFVRSWQDVAPAKPVAGNDADANGLRLASAAAETVGDAVARYYVTTSGSDQGLRGGRFRLSSNSAGYDLHLTGLRWTEDLAVSGTAAWDQLDGLITAHIALSAPGHSGSLTLSWNDRTTNAVASLSGQIDGTRLEAQRTAP